MDIKVFTIAARVAAAVIVPAMALSPCTDSKDEPDQPGTDEETNGKYVFAATITGSNGTAYDLVTGTSLDEGLSLPSTTVFSTLAQPNGCFITTISML